MNKSSNTAGSVLTIADEILKLAKRRKIGLTPMQLTKLAYVSHGWALALLGRGLFDDDIEAWKYGPVIPNLYHATKRFGRDPIPFDLVDEEASEILDAEVQGLLVDVFEKYGHFSGIQLSNLTHLPGSPWEQYYKPGGRNIKIPDSEIQRHYKDKLEAYAGRSFTGLV